MPTPLLTLKNIELSFGGDALLEGADLYVNKGDKIALVGRNGSGKSTLLKIISGLVEPDKGKRFMQPSTTICYLEQEPDLSKYETLLDYVKSGLSPLDDEHYAQYLLNQFGLSDDRSTKNLSGGEIKRAALAKVLAPNPDILLLDEPTNHLDLPAITWLQEELKNLKAALVIISHDRRFLSDLSSSTLWVDRGKTHQLNFGFDRFEVWREKFFEEEEIERHKLKRKIVREEHWVRYGVTARRKRNVRRMGELTALREEKKNQRAQIGKVALNAATAKVSGNIIIEAKNISKSFGDVPIINDFSTRIMRGDRVGIIGPNGAGKTTLVKLLIGELEPDGGEVKLGSNIELGLLDQTRSTLSPKTSLKDALSGGGTDIIEINGTSRHIISYMKDFLFSPEQAGTPLEKLSGGERARVSLAKTLSLPSNLLVLDEPTNDLDLETLDLLQEMIADYSGTAIIVSHDRDFLDRVATSIIAYEDNGDFANASTANSTWTKYIGGYSDYERQVKNKPSSQSQEKTPREKTKQQKSSISNKKKKLSFKQQHALKTLPKMIDDLTKNIAKIEEKLAQSDFYSTDREGFERLSKELIAHQEKLIEHENNWLEIEMEREELED